MKKIIKLFLMIFLVSSAVKSEAQIGNRLKQAASRGLGNALEKRIEKEAENIAQKQLEKAFENIYGSDMSAGGGFNMEKILSGLSMDVETAETYSFDGYTTMVVNSVDEKGKAQDPFTMKTYIAESNQTVAMEFENQDKKSNAKTILIYDLERNASIFLIDSDGKKNSMVYGYDFENMSEDVDLTDWENDLEDAHFTIRKSRNTKTIHGYTCDEYIAEFEDGRATYWITDKPIKGSGDFWGAGNPLMGTKAYQQQGSKIGSLPNGHMMEMYFESHEDQSKSEIKITEINENSPLTFQMKDYPNVLKGEGS